MTQVFFVGVFGAFFQQPTHDNIFRVKKYLASKIVRSKPQTIIYFTNLRRKWIWDMKCSILRQLMGNLPVEN